MSKELDFKEFKDNILLTKCPFCGAQGKIVVIAKNLLMPICSRDECVAGDAGAECESLSDAIDLWNSRLKVTTMSKHTPKKKQPVKPRKRT